MLAAVLTEHAEIIVQGSAGYVGYGYVGYEPAKLVQQHILLKAYAGYLNIELGAKILVGAYGVFCVADVGVLCAVV